MCEAFSMPLVVGMCLAASACGGRTGLQLRQPEVEGGQPSNATHDSGNGLPDAVASPPRCLNTAFDIPTPDSAPWQIVTGPDGAIWFTEFRGHKIGRITPDGAIAEFPIPTSNASPLGIAVGPDGQLWFAEAGCPDNAVLSCTGAIGRMSVSGSAAEFPLPTPNSDPVFITAGPDGNLWFVEQPDIVTEPRTASHVARITTGGEVAEFPLPTDSRVRQFSDRIVTGSDGSLWFASLGDLDRITTDGALTTVFQLSFSIGIIGTLTVGPDRDLWFSELEYAGGMPTGRVKLGRVSATGAVTEYPLPDHAAFGLVAGPDGQLWFVEGGSGRLGWISPDGFADVCELGSAIRSGCVGPDGAFWFLGATSNKVYRIQAGQ
jgi:streptogramin lyase